MAVQGAGNDHNIHGIINIFLLDTYKYWVNILFRYHVAYVLHSYVILIAFLGSARRNSP